jgi:hypothetical protein
MITQGRRAEAVVGGITFDMGTLAMTDRGRGMVIQSTLDIGSFKDSTFSDMIFGLLERGISSSSSELNEIRISEAERNLIQAKRSKKIFTIKTRCHPYLQRMSTVFLKAEESKYREKEQGEQSRQHHHLVR